MNVDVPETPRQAVAQGAQLLDDTYPGWWRLIDLETLQLSSCTDCVCGQLAFTLLNYAHGDDDSAYAAMRTHLGLDNGANHGFVIGLGWTYNTLEALWREVIQARLEADAINMQPIREVVPA